MKYFIPQNLGIDKFIEEVPPSGISGFKKENLLYILDLITSIPSTNKNLVLRNGYVPINSVILQKKVRNYKAYLNYLLENRIIVTDNHYIKGKKSIGYKFTLQYKGSLVPIEVLKERSRKIIKKGNLTPEIKKRYIHLLKWYNSELQIDEDLAIN